MQVISKGTHCNFFCFQRTVICSDSFKRMRFLSKLLPSPIHFAQGYGSSILGGTLRGLASYTVNQGDACGKNRVHHHPSFLRKQWETVGIHHFRKETMETARFPTVFERKQRRTKVMHTIFTACITLIYRTT